MFSLRRKFMNKNEKNKKKKLSTLPATLILILIALFLVFAGYMYLSLKNGYTADDLIDNIVGNLIGVLGAFLLFDIIYNKLTQDEYAEEVSQHITKTLMGDPETLDVFNESDKHNFLESTIRSIAKDEDIVDMLMGNMDRYLNRTDFTRVRTHFTYVISLSTDFPKVYADFPGVSEEKYFYVQENFHFDIKYLSDNYEKLSTNEVKIGFSFDKMSLDGGLLENGDDPEFSDCIFNENLDITKQAVSYLKGLTKEELTTKFEEMFTAVLKIDNIAGELIDVDLKPTGIVAKYKSSHDTKIGTHSVKVIFHMPKLWNSIFEVTLVDPTKSPQITFDYMPGKMNVDMYSYLNKESEANDGAYELQNGIYDVSVKDEWIYPKSGIVFHVTKLEEE